MRTHFAPTCPFIISSRGRPRALANGAAVCLALLCVLINRARARALATKLPFACAGRLTEGGGAWRDYRAPLGRCACCLAHANSLPARLPTADCRLLLSASSLVGSISCLHLKTVGGARAAAGWLQAGGRARHCHYFAPRPGEPRRALAPLCPERPVERAQPARLAQTAGRRWEPALGAPTRPSANNLSSLSDN